MKMVNVWGALITLLLALNCYLTYRSGLIYGLVPDESQTSEGKLACATDVNLRDCRKEWHLKGGERPLEFETK